MDNIKVRRSIQSHFIRGLWMLLALYKTLVSQTPGKYIWAFLLAFSIIMIGWVINNKSYLELAGSRLIINTDTFQTKSIEVSDIERIEIEPGLFSDSRIVLKGDKGVVKFNYHNVNDRDFNQLMKQLNIPTK